MIKFLYLVLFLLAALPGHSQNHESKKDSLKMYRSIESYAKKKGFTRTIYKAFFKPVSELNQKKSASLKIPSFKKYEGKIIRDIVISTYDPFGHDIRDTARAYQNFWTKAGNSLHLKTSPFAIRNQLLFHEGDQLEEFKIKESERLLRVSPYVRDVMIYAVAAGNDSVDVFIREIDVWTIIVKMSTVAGETKLQLIEKNFLGTGHQLDNSLRFVAGNNNVYEGIYTVPNFKNTFITTTLFYKADFDSIFYNGISLNRPFYSPLTKWAGGVQFSNTSTSDTLFYTDVIKTIPDVKYNQYDIWAGKSWPLFKKYSEQRGITNIILTTRYLNTDFLTNPLAGTDTLGILSDEIFYLASAGVSQRIYIKDSYIFRFGLTEDVPTGQVFSFTIGSQKKGSINRTYFGTRIGWGNYIEKAGYLAVNLEYGTFKNSLRMEQGVFSADVTYFTDLLATGKWKLRQFIKPRITLGMQRFPTDVLTINEEYGIRGFNSATLYGTNRLVFSTQTQLYAPYSLIGFRFAPVIYFVGALLSDNNQNLFNSRLYSSIGFGILFRNELLVFNTFQVSIAYYPVIPGLNNDLLKLNSIKSYDFRFRDFDIEKPGTITFQ